MSTRYFSNPARSVPAKHLARKLLIALALTGAAASADMAVPPPVEHVDGIAYRTGGVGIDEATAMKQEASRYPLELEFIEQAGKRGEYSAGEQVKIDGVGNDRTFTAQAQGPFMLVNLPDGKYRITASADGHDKTRVVDLSGDKPHDRIAFVWPAQEIEPRNK